MRRGDLMNITRSGTITLLERLRHNDKEEETRGALAKWTHVEDEVCGTINNLLRDSEKEDCKCMNALMT